MRGRRRPGRAGPPRRRPNESDPKLTLKLRGKWRRCREGGGVICRIATQWADGPRLCREVLHARPCAGHDVFGLQKERRGWPGRCPAMTKSKVVMPPWEVARADR